MKQEQINLDNLFKESMVVIPERVQRKIEHIPSTHPVWDWTFILSFIFLTPFVLWAVFHLSPFIPDLFTLLNQFHSASCGNIPLYFLFPIGVFISGCIGLSATLFLSLKEEYRIN